MPASAVSFPCCSQPDSQGDGNVIANVIAADGKRDHSAISTIDDPHFYYPYANDLQHQGLFGQAFIIAEQGLRLLQKNNRNTQTQLGSALLLLQGIIYWKVGLLDDSRKALYTTLQQLDMEPSSLEILQQVYQTLSFVCEQTGDIAQALLHQQHYHQVLQQKIERDNTQQLQELTAQYNTEQLSSQNAQLRLRSQQEQMRSKALQEQLRFAMLHLTGKNEFLHNFRESLRATMGSDDPRLALLESEFELLLNSERTWQIVEPQLRGFHHDIAARLAAHSSALTATELKVCTLLRLQLSNKEVAAMLCSSVRTVEGHRRNIRRKLGIAASIDLPVYLASL